jgi:antitoxin component YwqK of YwqJK toxin-antitoxin module
MKTGITILVMLFLAACKGKNPEEEISETRYIYDADGNVKSRVILKESKLNGEAIIYYPGGQISTTVNYINNKKEGVEKKYYQQGQLYRTRPFRDGKVNGFEKRYYKSGGIKTIQEFWYNHPATGLIEYSIGGKKLSDYPEIIFEIVKERDYEEQVLLLFYMSDRSKNVTYYTGRLIKNKYFDVEADPELCKDGVGEIWISPGHTGSFLISAKVVRESRGLFITQATVRLKNGNIESVD